jgi:hypothetical protein
MIKRATPDKNRYAVKWVPWDSIHPSPENIDLYGEVMHDDAMDALVESIDRNGMDQPITVTAEKIIVSGHRRHYAAGYLDWPEVPVMIRKDIKHKGNKNFHRVLMDYNPQRVKSVGAVLREALLRDNNPRDTYAAIRDREDAAVKIEPYEFLAVQNDKEIREVSEKQQEFLAATIHVIQALEMYWPLSIRQIHYRLLNDPPLKQTPKRSKFDVEYYRYKNDDSSYNSLVSLLTAARYGGQVSMSCIDDPTRPQKSWGGFDSVNEFVEQEIRNFLRGYHRDRQMNQPRYIEVFAEKNTLMQILKQACKPYYVPFSIGRGFCSIPVWRDIAQRFRASQKKAMTLIIVSDYDYAGLELADDAIRSLRLHGVQPDGHRIAVTREQIDELDLADDFNPVKEEGKKLERFQERTGDSKTWECEALPPDYLVEQIKAAIEANMDMEIFEAVCKQEREDCGELCKVKEKIASQLNL